MVGKAQTSVHGPVELERQGHVAIITMRRPEARNAINAAMASGIEAAIDELEADADLWVGILAAEGPAFCAGADLKQVDAGDIGGISTERGGFGGIVARRRTKPLIAAVEGPAVAGGTEITTACDMVIAGRTASFGIPEVKRSLVAAAGGLFRLPRKIPWNVAVELALTGDPVDATRAHEIGLVNHLVDEGHALEGALALAARITANAPLAVAATRRVMEETRWLDDDQAFEVSLAAGDSLRGTEDYREGPRAFIEKRPPSWVGR